MDKRTTDRRQAARRVVEAFELLPPDRRQWFLGWAEGVIDATRRQEAKDGRMG